MGRELADEPRVIEVEAQERDALYDFSCGGQNEWEVELDAVVRKLARTGGPRETRAYVAEDDSNSDRGALIGVASFFPWWLGVDLPELPPVDDAICLQAIGIAAAYRGAQLPDGERVGGWLLDQMLEQIGRAWPNETRPVWALVHKGNERCRRMLRPRHFELFEVSGNYDVWVRAREAASRTYVA